MIHRRHSSATVFAAMAIAAIPTASAEQCTVTVTLVTGQT